MGAAESSDHRDAADIATSAGRLLLHLRGSGPTGDALKSLGDQQSHDLIIDELSRRHPEDAVLSEEGADDRGRLSHDRVWIVDPLDGTREFAEPERDDWAVHVALAIEGTVRVGAVALPARGLSLETGGRLPAIRSLGRPPRLVVSRTRPTEYGLILAQRLGADLIPMGSAGAKAMAVVLGEADVYAHSGGQYEWDSAAPVAVAMAAGLHVSRLDGSPLRYNQPNPWLPDVLICHPSLAAQVIAICGVESARMSEIGGARRGDPELEH